MNLNVNLVMLIAWVSFMAGLAVSEYFKEQYKKYLRIMSNGKYR